MSRYDALAAKNIKAAMDSQNTNPHAISRKAGIHYATLNRKLDGGSFTLEQLDRIAKALDTDAAELLKDAA